MSPKKLKDTFHIGEIAGLFSVEEPDWTDSGDAYHYGYEYALKEGQSEEEAEEYGQKCEQEEIDEAFRNWANAVEYVAADLFEKHGLSLQESKKHKYNYKVVPIESWRDAARHIVTTINGVGMFEFRNVKEFLDSGPYTAREAVLQHLHVIEDWVEVYEGGKARDQIYRRMR